MNEYDLFMAELLEAGWSWEAANALWEKHDPDCCGEGYGSDWNEYDAEAYEPID